MRELLLKSPHFCSCIHAVCLIPLLQWKAVGHVESMQWHRLDWSSEVALIMSLKQRFLSCTAMTQQGRGLPGPGLSPHEEQKEVFIHGNPHQHQTKQGSVESEAAHTNPSHSSEERASAPTNILLHNSSESPSFKAVVNHLCARNEITFVHVSVFLELKRKCLGLKGKIPFEESFLKVLNHNNYEHWMYTMKEHVS